jgi:hypothetical protein
MTSRLSKETVMNAGGHPLAPPPDRWRQLAQSHDPRLDLSRGLFREPASCYSGDPCAYLTNDQLITKIPVFHAYTPQVSTFHEEMTREPVLLHMAVGADRVWFARRIEMVAASRRNFAAFKERSVAMAVSPIVVHAGKPSVDGAGTAEPETDDDELLRIGRLSPAERVPTQVIRYRPTELYLSIDAPASGWILVTDRWGPGWRADVNGRSVPVLAANFVFRAVEVQAGPNLVRFWYRPAAFPGLVLLSWSVMLALAVMSIRAFRRPTRRNDSV